MNDTISPSANASLKPTRVRYAMLFLLCLLAMITYMDRAANGSAKKIIMSDLGVSESKFYYVLLAFQLAYALFEIPSGWLGDTRGPRSTLLRVVVWWSAFVALTGFTATTLPFTGIYIGFYGLMLIQFLFGVGEAGAFPNIAKALYNWFPVGDRGFAKSIVWMSARFMGGLTPLLWVLLVEIGGLSWREAMWLFAGVAVLWCVAFFAFFRNKPSEHPSVNAVELEMIERGRSAVSSTPKSVPWKIIFTSRNLWAVCLMYIVTNFCWYFMMYNLPTALKAGYSKWNATDGGKILLALLSGMPLLVGMLGCLLGGILSDVYIRRTGDRKWGRRLLGMVGYGGAGLCYLAAAGVKWYDPDNLWLFVFFIILMGFMNDLIMAPAWATCQDIGQSYAATVSGTMNMVGNLFGAVTGILVTGLIEDTYKGNGTSDWMIYCFILYSAVYFLGVIAWMFIDASKPIASEDPAAPNAN